MAHCTRSKRARAALQLCFYTKGLSEVWVGGQMLGFSGIEILTVYRTNTFFYSAALLHNFTHVMCVAHPQHRECSSSLLCTVEGSHCHQDNRCASNSSFSYSAADTSLIRGFSRSTFTRENDGPTPQARSMSFHLDLSLATPAYFQSGGLARTTSPTVAIILTLEVIPRTMSVLLPSRMSMTRV